MHETIKTHAQPIIYNILFPFSFIEFCIFAFLGLSFGRKVEKEKSNNNPAQAGEIALILLLFC